jgi:hypothetical protein
MHAVDRFNYFRLPFNVYANSDSISTRGCQVQSFLTFRVVYSANKCSHAEFQSCTLIGTAPGQFTPTAALRGVASDKAVTATRHETTRLDVGEARTRRLFRQTDPPANSSGYS